MLFNDIKSDIKLVLPMNQRQNIAIAYIITISVNIVKLYSLKFKIHCISYFLLYSISHMLLISLLIFHDKT